MRHRATPAFWLCYESLPVDVQRLPWRDKDRMHLRDLIGVGLLDATWPPRLPPPLGEQLQQLLDDPHG